MEINAKELSNALTILSKSVPKRSTLPILQSVLFSFAPDRVMLSVTDLETAISVVIPGVQCSGEGMAVRFDQLKKFVSSRGGVVIFHDPEASNKGGYTGMVVVEQDHSTVTLDSYPIQDCPVLPFTGFDRLFTLSGDDMQQVKDIVLPHAALDDSRPVLAGIEVHIKDNDLTFAAADGFTLGVFRTRIEVACADQHIIIPQSVFKMIPPKVESFAFSRSANGEQVQFQFETRGMAVTLMSRTIQGHFPDYEQIIPKSSSATVLLRTHVVEAASKGIGKQSTYGAAGDALLLLSEGLAERTRPENQRQSWNHDSVTLENVERVAFNPVYLARALPLAKNGYVELVGVAPNSPWKVETDNAVAVIMPMVVGTN